jgi:tetratricopeptide (TPR) repeat protein
MRRGALTDAIAHFKAARELNPSMPDANYNLGMTYQSAGNVSRAIASFGEAVRLRPDWPEALTGLAWLLSTAPDERLRNPPEAVRLATRAATLTGSNDAAVLDVLAAAYAASGQFGRAMELERHAIDLERSSQRLAEFTRRRALYEQSRPYRQPDR